MNNSQVCELFHHKFIVSFRKRTIGFYWLRNVKIIFSDLFRVCPSKLSRRELEDLYFSLIENNTHLKKTLNGQKDQIKVLTTKVNRLTAQKNALGTQKDCCVSTRAIINEQKES